MRSQIEVLTIADALLSTLSLLTDITAKHQVPALGLVTTSVVTPLLVITMDQLPSAIAGRILSDWKAVCRNVAANEGNDTLLSKQAECPGTTQLDVDGNTIVQLCARASRRRL